MHIEHYLSLEQNKSISSGQRAGLTSPREVQVQHTDGISWLFQLGWESDG